MLYTGSIFAPPKPGSAPRGMYYAAAWCTPVFFRMPLDIDMRYRGVTVLDSTRQVYNLGNGGVPVHHDPVDGIWLSFLVLDSNS